MQIVLFVKLQSCVCPQSGHAIHDMDKVISSDERVSTIFLRKIFKAVSLNVVYDASALKKSTSRSFTEKSQEESIPGRSAH
jgi:hypothetical protein